MSPKVRPAPATRFHIARLLLLAFVLASVGIYEQMRRLRARVTERVGWITATQPYASPSAATTDAQRHQALSAARAALSAADAGGDRRRVARALILLLTAQASPAERAPRAVALIVALRRET